MVVGIDLGTTFSVAAYVDDDGQAHVIPNQDGGKSMPSVVMFNGDEAIVGQHAKKMAASQPYSVAQFAKRHIGSDFKFLLLDDNGQRESRSPEAISAVILRRLMQDCEAYLDEQIEGVVITVPAYFDDAQKNATLSAAKMAGINNILKIIHEPTAAALAYGIGKSSKPLTILIYDLGGGTFDTTIAEVSGNAITVLATSGNKRLGGADFDTKLVSQAAKQILDATKIDVFDDGYEQECQELRELCENAKIELSMRQKFSFTLSLGQQKTKVEFTRDQFAEMINPYLEQTGYCIDRTLEDACLTSADIAKVILVGGSSKIPAVGEYLHKKIGIKPSKEVNPDEIVAIGAAICAKSLADTGKNSNQSTQDDENSPNVPVGKIVDVNAHSFGMIVLSNEDEVNSIIIPRNQPLRRAFTKVFYTAAENQTALNLRVTEGELSDLNYVDKIGESTIKLTPHPKGSPIAVEFAYDDNGIITGRVYDLFETEYDVDGDEYLIGGIESLKESPFLGEINITRSHGISEQDIAVERNNIQLMKIQ